MQDVIERLDRRYEQLARQKDDVEFLPQLPTYLDALDSERSAKRVVKRLRADAERAVEEFNNAEHALMKETVEIRRPTRRASA